MDLKLLIACLLFFSAILCKATTAWLNIAAIHRERTNPQNIMAKYDGFFL